MDYKKSNAPLSTITRNISDLDAPTDNIYEAIMIIAKRATQVGVDIKKELVEKLDEFAANAENLEEVFENKEQIEVSRFYEKLPKPTSIAIQEWIENRIYYRNPVKETQENPDFQVENKEE
ncbi:MAG: DNA-directed RNA polymerase subunit omega [Flavobacteriales bacterium]|nr:DNA-directed RNA polymerase subunit omega [Flavobacteriales bacterium]